MTEWGQIVGGMGCRIEQYQEKVRYFQGKRVAESIVEGCGEEEAKSMIGVYEDLIGKLVEQLQKIR